MQHVSPDLVLPDVDHSADISKEEHAILSEVHPNVESIQKRVDEVSDEGTRVKGKVEEQR
jgi:hypothetical protein